MLGECRGRLLQAHGLTELHRVERLLAGRGRARVRGLGRTRVAAGRAAIELGERNGYHRAAVRTWFALLPIAGARGDFELLLRGAGLVRRAGAFAGRRGGDFAVRAPDGVRRRARPGASRAAATSRRRDARCPAAPSWPTPNGMPSWLAATDEVLGLWAEQGDARQLRAALERREADERRRTPPRSAIGLDELGVRTARRRLRHAPARRCARSASSAAPWWLAKALRVLGRSARTERVPRPRRSSAASAFRQRVRPSPRPWSCGARAA